MKKLKLYFATMLYVAVISTSNPLSGQKLKAVDEAIREEKPESNARADTSLVRIEIVRAKLKNGLRVVMNPDHTVPTVAIALYYDVGSRNEVRGRSGFAHLFEHMMFQGSRNVGKMEHFLYIAKRGGDANGSTSHDRTNYYETLPSHELALGLWLEADRMRSLKITQENFENQRQTVMEERRQSYDNQPYRQSMLRINELAYGDYWPYAHSTIGDMQDLQNAPLKAVQDFFHDYYTPKNSVLGIAGDFDPAEAMSLVQRYFGDISGRDAPEYKPGKLSAQSQERVESMEDPLAELPAFHIAYHIPPVRHPDHYPLEMLETILGDGESSRLYQELVKKRQYLQEIEVGTDGRRGPDLFSFWGICAKGHSGEQARKVIYAQLEEIAKKGVTKTELQKAQNRVRAAFLFGLQTNLARALHLAEYEMYFGDARLLLDEFDLYRAVTVEDIKRVVRQYFTPNNRTVLDVLPAASRGGVRRQS
ncbi:MAG: insulinase family protein [Deltaproteobacteria bacterium]|nr:insulinase family protein [Deltaproteobacteria bacterium]